MFFTNEGKEDEKDSSREAARSEDDRSVGLLHLDEGNHQRSRKGERKMTRKLNQECQYCKEPASPLRKFPKDYIDSSDGRLKSELWWLCPQCVEVSRKQNKEVRETQALV